MNFPPVKEQIDLLSAGAEEIIPLEELEQKLVRAEQSGEPLRVKFGADPSAPDMHIGHAVPLRKLRQFQDLGHQVDFLIGDFTGMVGDPSGKNKTRQALTREEVLANAETYKKQVFKILDPARTSIRFNSEWFEAMDIYAFLALTSRYTVARMLERDDFEKRFKGEVPIAIIEFLYPLIQGYDSVALRSDVEIGGTDQKFNLLMGRLLQREYGQEPQVIMMVPILEGTDGVEKMSKSLDNYIGINDPAREIFGRAMSIPDELIYRYFLLATNRSPAELSNIKAELEAGSVNPMIFKRQLARDLVDIYVEEGAGAVAEAEFDTIFREKDIPDEIPEFQLEGEKRLIELMAEQGLAPSLGQARKLIRQNAVSLDGEKVNDEGLFLNINSETILKVGKRRFLKLLP